MGITRRDYSIGVSRRADGEPWRLNFVELDGGTPGPVTAFVGGIFGDKPLCTLALWGLVDRLLGGAEQLRGRVLLCPAANPFALQAGTRISPDHLFLNRVFPGAPGGFLTNQIAHALLTELRNSTDCVIDLHSGTPDMALWYSYDYGDEELSAAFGYTPIVKNMAQPGQLSKAFTDAGGKSVLVEFGGGALGDAGIGVEGCLNVLRYRGQIDGKSSGPGKVPLIDGRVSMYLPSQTGALVSVHPTTQVGRPIPRGPVAWLVNPGTGERVEEFSAAEEGALLMLARSSPAMLNPGDFGAVIAYPQRDIPVPNT